ncbi:MAG: 2,3-bisphosphoglycerate-independent phosphoglycerate mutase [Clostridiales bacterium]|jgi:2,3-bisphosphoglycerate-independent phosphoglycerate mutase|nr:2,3-bisphosphoglycerate-independent phosphoglycerate mutase [Clostridiales bacterium]
MSKKTVALIILDGVGISSNPEYNAVAMQGMPNINKLIKTYPHTTIKTSGRDVGLPSGQMGNSEVGHLNIGAGRVVYQDITAIDKSIEDGDFYNNSCFKGAVANCQQHKSALHLVGLLSNGGVHSSIEHLYALLTLAKRNGLNNVYVHCITDGRDVPPKSALEFVAQLQDKIDVIGVGKISTVVGRYYYMDRDNRWDRVKVGYDCVVNAMGAKYDNAIQGIQQAYKDGLTDEFLPSMIVGDYKGVAKNDSMIFFNFRPDRAREISRAILDPEFKEFDKIGGHKSLYYVGFTKYDIKYDALGIHTAFAPKSLKNTLGEWLSAHSRSQVRIAETEKYAHVTFFFNGGIEEPNDAEQRILVASPKVATYDLQPEMSAREVTDKAIAVLQEGVDVMILNYANCDMVGHTANVDASIKAVETVDNLCYELVQEVLKVGGVALVTADHGNIEQLAYSDGSPCTSHTTNDVRLLLVGDKYKKTNLSMGRLADIAPTMLEILQLPKPEEMDGVSLIVK